jgi:hypothetical protein
LKQPPFDQKDESIFDCTTGSTKPDSTGSCASCPKRTGNAREEYPDAKANICTDPDCYRAKVKASVETRIAAAEADGLDVLEQDESETALRHGGRGPPARQSARAALSHAYPLVLPVALLKIAVSHSPTMGCVNWQKASPVPLWRRNTTGRIVS